MWRRALIGGWLAWGLLSAAAGASSVVHLPEPGSAAWAPVAFRGIERATRYDVVEVDGQPAFLAQSECGASGMSLELAAIDLSRTPRLAWRWRIDRLPMGADEQTKDGDDFAARVSLLYRRGAARASWLERLQARIAAGWYGREMPGSAIEFVWTRALPVGTRWPNPFQQAAQMVALKSGAPVTGEDGSWQSAIVDLVAERRRAGEDDDSPPVAIAIMSDSDNTCSRSRAWFADFRLLPP